MNRTNSRIAEDSKRKIGNALFTLMKVYHYREITVTQLAQEAELSRKTFYRLFNDKDEVLALVFDTLFREFFALIRTRGITHYWELVQLYFDFWESRKDTFFLLGKNDLLSRMFEYVYRNAETIFVAIRTTEKGEEFARPLPYLLAYSVGGMHSMLIKWVELGMSIPSQMLINQLKAGFQSPEL